MKKDIAENHGGFESDCQWLKMSNRRQSWRQPRQDCEDARKHGRGTEKIKSGRCCFATWSRVEVSESIRATCHYKLAVHLYNIDGATLQRRSRYQLRHET
ncbi:hypothetical protein [Burkholderia metallica]|uniref:hypothetical protein n=1 Tax=Burkholderia metallica TaxID=488729 RepID=UPI003C7A8FB9